MAVGRVNVGGERKELSIFGTQDVMEPVRYSRVLENDDESFTHFLFLDNKENIFTCVKNTSTGTHSINKYDKNYNLLSSYKMNTSYYDFRYFSIDKYNDVVLYDRETSTIVKLDNNLENEIWRKNCSTPVRYIDTLDDYILLAQNHSVNILDRNGEEVLTIDSEDSIESAIFDKETNDFFIFISGGNRNAQRYDINGNLIWENSIRINEFDLPIISPVNDSYIYAKIKGTTTSHTFGIINKSSGVLVSTQDIGGSIYNLLGANGKVLILVSTTYYYQVKISERYSNKGGETVHSFHDIKLYFCALNESKKTLIYHDAKGLGEIDCYTKILN